jgi:alkane 1-monooxygenase
MVLDSYGEGGIIENVATDKLDFYRDIGPHFMSTWVMIVVHVFYYFTGNMAVMMFGAMLRVAVTLFNDNEKNLHKRNVARKTEKMFMDDQRFAIPMITCQIGGLFTWIWVLCIFSDDVKFDNYYFSQLRPRTWPQLAVFFFNIGFLSSIETSCAHELIHRRENYAKYIGMFSFSKIFYLHFKDVHVASHHKKMATPEDPFFGRLNESLYGFAAKELVNTYMDQWNSEIKRIRKQHGSDCPWIAYIVFNKMIYFALLQFLQCFIIYKLLGWNSLKYHFVHAAGGLFFLIFANYITHYGLERRKDKNGFYESINKYHSWNFVSSNIFWGIPRHSDHHNASFRPYQILRRMDEAPWIPYQMIICLLMTICPPLWKWVINPRAKAANDFNAGIPNNYVSFNYMQPKTA